LCLNWPEFSTDLPELSHPSSLVLTDWNPEDQNFWEKTGKRIATRNLWISIPALLLAFAVWMVWSVWLSICLASALNTPPMNCSAGGVAWLVRGDPAEFSIHLWCLFLVAGAGRPLVLPHCCCHQYG